MQDITLHEVGGELVINVPNESTVIGRGQFLQVTDKRVSRSHALLEISDGKLYITPTHTNPCFMRIKGSKDQKALARDVKQHLDHGDEFGLLPDQFFYRVSYPQLNGNERDELKKEDSSLKSESLASAESVSNGIAADAKDGGKPTKKEASVDLDKSRKSSTSSLNNEEEKEEKENSSEDESKEDNEPDKVTVEGQGDMTLPLKKKRALPDWMEKVAESPTKSKPPAKKQKPMPASKKAAAKLAKSESDNDNISDEEEEEITSGKASKGPKVKDSDEDFGEEASDDDYVPEKTSKKRGGKAQKKKRKSDSEDDFSDDDDDDDYSPKKSKSKSSKKSAKGKGSARAKKTPVRAPRSTPQRSRAKKKNSDLDEEDDNEEALPRRRRVQEEEEESTLRRPQRAARQKRGSYVDDPMIEEALEDFASEGENDVNEDKDSDFMVEGEEESGSDWEKSASGSQKQKASKSKSKGPPKGPTKRVASKKKKPRRSSKAKDNSDKDEDEMEDDEPYIPRPSKRRGGTVSHESEESDEGGNKKKRRREPCQYGKKCYRKNPVHFRTYCHPGDSSYDEEDKDSASPKEVSRKEKESRTGSEKPSRPQRSTAGTRLVTHGTDDGNADDNDDGMQHSDESGADDSDYVAEADAQERTKDAKKIQKTKKQAKAVESD
ncbi:hypothetical protein BsWGS_14972 [Bradybaena similaris]